MKLVVSFEIEIETDDVMEAVLTAIEISEDPRLWRALDVETGDSYGLVHFLKETMQ